MNYPVITIDGPSGAGKGTLAYKLARYFGFNLLDSGALYRVVGLLAYQAGILTDQMLSQKTPPDSKIIQTLIQSLQVDFVIDDRSQMTQILLNNQRFVDDIRNEHVGKMASVIATLPAVRSALLGIQQSMAERAGVVADGRDMGTVVFTKAQAKIFLTASDTARANRRVSQLIAMGKQADYKSILSDIQARDEQDQNRLTAPLKPADDALIIDSSSLSADDVLAVAVDYCRQCGIER